MDLIRVCVVGGNAVSAFLSWRLQATNACDVTLVWKSGFDAVYQYGISFKSTSFGNERFKPRHVVRAPEEAANNKEGAFDYVLLCVKALPDVYDLAAVIESVVTPQHTCILVNTTHTLGVEAQLESRFPSNVVLSLVSGAEITQLGASEFEHKGSTEVWVGPANKNPSMPSTIQGDMADALAMTLSSGQVDCHVSSNIRQQQYERMIGPIAFHPLSVIFETASHAALLEKVGVRQLVSDVFDELLSIANAQSCSFPADFKQRVMEEMVRPTEANSIMYQDFNAKRPMEVETYLGSPIKLAQGVGVKVPRIETLYAILHNLNIVNQQRKDIPLASPAAANPPVRLPSVPPPRPMMNGAVNGNGPMGPPRGRGRTPSMNGPPPGMRRGPPPPINGGPPNGYGRPMTGNGYQPPRNQSRRGSLEGNDLEEFSHLVLYDDIPESGESNYGGDGPDIALRERELMLRQRELALREQELRLQGQGAGPRRGPFSRRGPPTPSVRNGGGGFDEDDDDNFVDPADGPPPPMIDPDNFDMMSVTSRRNRKNMPNASQIRKNPEYDGLPPPRRGGGFMRPGYNRNRSSARIISQVPGAHDNLMDDPLMAYSSNRYGNVDRAQMGMDSRTNSLTAARLDELQYGGGPAGPPGPPNGNGYPRRASQSPGNPYSPQMGRGNGRPSPPNGYMGPPMNGRPSPPGGMRQPVPRHPPGQGNAVAPQQVEQYAGVSALHPPKGPVNVRSLTGSASASAGSGDSANIDSEPSAHSSQSSLGPRPAIGVR
ncbi:ApbA-domain-containing protein [Mollisia scopiformis]|uniref:ApbA-domain-containing protein n=1 Tax=Mollisia scopiformis TaxID=149040 RepID=A0A194XT38_MOLSC|nr:ApbA-domain-containing protein [Mollisia scopiformis]KUJ23470.1 ApbA-domain-containing protein [Mollisia scopiformis]